MRGEGWFKQHGMAVGKGGGCTVWRQVKGGSMIWRQVRGSRRAWPGGEGVARVGGVRDNCMWISNQGNETGGLVRWIGTRAGARVHTVAGARSVGWLFCRSSPSHQEVEDAGRRALLQSSPALPNTPLAFSENTDFSLVEWEKAVAGSE